jgi:hypothetical protein
MFIIIKFTFLEALRIFGGQLSSDSRLKAELGTSYPEGVKIDPLVCPQCGQEMRVIAVITDPFEVNKILECRKRNNAPVFDKEVTKVS